MNTLFRLSIAALLAALLVLQYRLWVSDDGVREVMRLRADLELRTEENGELRARNEQLEAEVRDLRDGLDSVEERARAELGMIGAEETFYQVVEPGKSAAEKPQ